MGAFIAVALLFPAAAVSNVATPAVEAGGRSCTGWHSTQRPPNSIRVYRHAKGVIQTVDFRRYVAVVMASEWPDYLPQAAIEAGAVAVKQFAWNKVLAGHHRSSYVTRDGRCYDVTDRVYDQLFRPEHRKPGRKVMAAVNKTWPISLRKNGRFFETGYRRGSNVRCGRDADGRRLFARSVIKCARQGMSRERIQFLYYGKGLTIHYYGGGTVHAGGGDQSPKGQAKPKPKATPKPTPKATQKPKGQQAGARNPATPRPQPSPRPQPAPSPAPIDPDAVAALLAALPPGDAPMPGPGPESAAFYAPWLADWPWIPSDIPAGAFEDWSGIWPPPSLADSLADAGADGSLEVDPSAGLSVTLAAANAQLPA